MRFRVLPKILLITGFLFLAVAIKFQNQIREFAIFQTERLKAHSDNFFYFSSSEVKRRAPLSLLKQETELQLYIGDPFRSFKRKDWQEFWKLIYGAFPKDNPAREGFPIGMRQLTQEEIAYELEKLYPQPFSYFRETHWKTFFSIISLK